jgi:hypothetical protein
VSLAKKIEQRRASKPAQAADDGELSVRIANLERDLADARAKLGEHEKSALSWQEKAQQAEARYTSEKLRSAIRNAALAANAVDPDEVTDLVLPKGARIDGDRVVFGQGAEAKPAAEYVAAYLEGKPHLRKAAPVAQGSGAPATQATSAPSAAPALSKPDPTDSAAVAAYYAAQRDATTKAVTERIQSKRAR